MATLSVFHSAGEADSEDALPPSLGSLCLLEGRTGTGEKLGVIGHVTAAGASSDGKRGPYFLSMDRLETFVYTQCHTRSRKDENNTAADIQLDSNNKVEERFVKAMLKSVQGSMDMIIDPTLDEQGWLPHTENGEVLTGNQKSTVGECFTIGDGGSDGAQFLSFDDGETYLLDPVLPADKNSVDPAARHGWKPPPRPPSPGREREIQRIAKFQPGKLREKGGTEWRHALGRPREGLKSPRRKEQVDSPTKMLLPGETMPQGKRVALKPVPSLNGRANSKPSPKKQEPETNSPSKMFAAFQRESALMAAAEYHSERKKVEDKELAISKKARRSINKKKVNAVLLHRFVSTHESNRGQEISSPSEFSAVEYLVEWAGTGLQQWIEKSELLQYPEPAPSMVKQYTTTIVSKAASLRGGVGVQNMTIKGGPQLDMPAMSAMFEPGPPPSTSISSAAAQSSAMRKRRVRRMKKKATSYGSGGTHDASVLQQVSDALAADRPDKQQQPGGMTEEMLMQERLQQFREEMEVRIAKLEAEEQAAKAKQDI